MKCNNERSDLLYACSDLELKSVLEFVIFKIFSIIILLYKQFINEL
jgi:hypothetical protein